MGGGLAPYKDLVVPGHERPSDRARRTDEEELTDGASGRGWRAQSCASSALC